MQGQEQLNDMISKLGREDKCMKKDIDPPPRIGNILDTLAGSKYFTSLDLASGYWQAGMGEESIPKSAFVTHCELFEFVRIPLGLCNALATFQWLIEVVLTGLLWKECFAYIDDVLVSSPDSWSHLPISRRLLIDFARQG